MRLECCKSWAQHLAPCQDGSCRSRTSPRRRGWGCWRESNREQHHFVETLVKCQAGILLARHKILNLSRTTTQLVQLQKVVIVSTKLLRCQKHFSSLLVSLFCACYCSCLVGAHQQWQCQKNRALCIANQRKGQSDNSMHQKGLPVRPPGAKSCSGESQND